jgi:hypothetical protein
MKKRAFSSRCRDVFQRLTTASWLWWVAIGLFVLQAGTLVFVTKFGVPPDETNHISFIDYYTDHSLDPFFTDQQPTYNLGDKTREVDYLYHYVMSLVRRVLPFSHTTEFYMIRLCTVGLAVLTFWVLRRVFRRVGISDTVSALWVLLASSFSMVLMMSSAVNNDVLIWLGVALGLLLIVRLWQERRLVDLLWLAALVAYVGLAKRTLLPVAAVFVLIGLWFAVRYAGHFWRELRHPTVAVVVALVVLLVGVGLSVERIGVNVLRYGGATPSCNDVQGEQACSGFWWNMRERELARQPRGELISRTEFVGRWLHENLINILDIQTQGWRHEIKPARWIEPVWWAFLVVGLVAGISTDVKRFMKDVLARKRLLVLAVAFAFIAVLFFVNYGEYQRTRIFGVALNGRYTLAGFLPLLAVVLWYWHRLLGRRYAVQVGLYALLLFLTMQQSGLWLLLHNPQLMHG